MFRYLMLIFLSIVLLSFSLYEDSLAQNNSDVSVLRNLYKESKFDDLLFITESKDDLLNTLYRGKSLYALDRCSEAMPYLSRARASDELEIKEDANWTIILCLVQLRDFIYASHTLFDSDDLFSLPTYRKAAIELRRDILSFLNDEQLLRLSRTITNSSNLLDLYRYGTFTNDSPISSHLKTQLSLFKVDSLIVNSIQKPSYIHSQRTPPKGFTYRIGVLLPFNEDPSSNESQNSKSLYNGLLLALDEQTEISNNQYIHVQLLNSTQINDSSYSIVNPYWIEKPLDIIIGPLYSSRISTLSSHISAFNTPIIVPLANSDEIQTYNSSFIQLNPPFSVHGRQMARYAVNTLGIDTVSIIADRNSLGYSAAVAFKEEAEQLGALISTFYAENMASTGYDISEFTKTLYADSIMIDSLNLIPPEAIYAPFTGAGAQTLIRLLMTDLTAKKNPLQILGLEEWNSEESKNLRLDSAQIYYSTSFNTKQDSVLINEFVKRYESRFGEEPNELAQTGYDTGSFVWNLLTQFGNPSELLQHLRNPKTYIGLRQRYEIRNYVNQSVEVYPLFE